MNTTLNSPVESNTHAQQPPAHPPEPVGPRLHRRVGLLDRAALHLGLALITWSRRRSQLTHEQATAMIERERLRQEYQRERDRLAATQLLRRIM